MHKEGFECACMGIGCVYGRGRVCVHGERVCIWLGWSGRMCAYEMCPVCMHEEREGVCIWKSLSVYAWGEEGCVHMEGFECACMWRGSMCAYGSGRMVCMGRGRCVLEGVEWRAWGEDVCIWRGSNGVHGERDVYLEGVECVHGRGRVCIWKGWSVHG